MFYRYTPVKEYLFHPDIGHYISFGIEALDKHDNIVCFVSDVSPDFNFVKNLTKLCTKEQLDPIHLLDIIEDHI